MAAVLDPPRNVRPATIAVRDAARLLGVSGGPLYKMSHDGRLPTVRVGNRILVRRDTVERLLGNPLPVRICDGEASVS